MHGGQKARHRISSECAAMRRSSSTRCDGTPPLAFCCMLVDTFFSGSASRHMASARDQPTANTALKLLPPLLRVRVRVRFRVRVRVILGLGLVS